MGEVFCKAAPVSSPEPSRRSVPSLVILPLFLVLGTFTVIVQKMAVPVSNSDTYFHLRLGREFLGSWTARTPESVTSFATSDWTPTQWWGQVAYAQFEQWFGLPGVAWLTGAIVLLFALVLFFVSRRESSIVVAAFVVPASIVACAPNLSGRPQVISYILIALVVSSWLHARRTGSVPWWIIPCVWLWALLHGMWSIGVLVSVVSVAGIALERKTPRGTLVKMLYVPVLSIGAAALTPLGMDIYTASARVSSISKYFAEWGPANFTQLHVLVAASMAALALLVALRSGPVEWTPLLLLLLAGAWLVYSLRTVPVAATMLAPLLAQQLNTRVPRRERSRLEVPVVLTGFAAALGVLALLVPHTSTQSMRADNRAEDSVGTLPAGTPLLNEWKDGGYTMWRHPQLNLVMHGYGDMFTDDELARNQTIRKLEHGWVEALEELEVTEALLDSGSGLAYALTTLLDWEVVVEDDGLEHLRAPD